MKTPDFIILDFDSTFVKYETLDVLADIALKESPEKTKKSEMVKRSTQKAMDGLTDFSISLTERLSLFNADIDHIKSVINTLKSSITPSFLKYKRLITSLSDRIYVVSGGFREVILPVCEEYGLRSDHIFSNEFLYNYDGRIKGVDGSKSLSKNDGKSSVISSLKLKGDGVLIGDGMTDWEAANRFSNITFYALTENVRRDNIVKKSKFVFDDGGEIFKKWDVSGKMNAKNKKVLLLENINQKANQHFLGNGFDVEVVVNALSEKDLVEKIKDVNVLCIRSKTKVSASVLDKAEKLESVGCFCIGTDQVDLNYAAKKGVSVFNAPYSNTRSVVELALGSIIMLSRRVFDKSMAMHSGVWDKSLNNSCEVRGKVLGIVGYGKIGSQLSIVAESMGMNILYYDVQDRLPIGNAKVEQTLRSLLKKSDFISIHIDGRSENKNLIDLDCFNEMKSSACLINYSRGKVVDLEALSTALKQKLISGAAIDVFPVEPESKKDSFNNHLQQIPNTILTPHIGGNTIEAQENIGCFVAERLVEYINRGTSVGCLNLPELDTPMLAGAVRLVHIHENRPGIIAKINAVLSKNNINVEGQYLSTIQSIGYVVTDVNSYADSFIEELENIPHTLNVRIIE